VGAPRLSTRYPLAPGGQCLRRLLHRSPSEPSAGTAAGAATWRRSEIRPERDAGSRTLPMGTTRRPEEEATAKCKDTPKAVLTLVKPRRRMRLPGRATPPSALTTKGFRAERSVIRRTRFLLPLLLIFAPLAEAASPSASLGWVLGRVVDRDGHPLAGVSVVLTLTSGDQTEILRLTDALGGFRFEGIPQGQGYRLRLSLPAYQTLEFSEVEVEAGETRLDDIVLNPALTERVTVRAAPDVVRTDSAVTRTEISGEFLEGLPILGRDYQDILTLAPGVTDVDHTGNPNIHGARDTDVLTLVDGINTTDPYSGHYGQELNSESIQDIEIITAGATAEYSRAQGGFVNILTKSGGNEFKGSFRMFLRSYRLDGDGAGIDPGELRGGVGERDGFRDLRFTDLYPFLSASGPVERDHLWYYAAPEFVQAEEPVNAGTQAFIQRTRSLRATGKLTWQMTPSQKLSLLGLFDATDQNNQGLDSRTLPESGYSFHRGGPTTTLQQTALVSASLALETSLSRFDQSFSVIPTLDADTNGNGILFVDDNPRLGGNQDGFLDARERDPGEDYDADGRFDLFEDFNRNGSFGACFQDPETHQRVCANDLDRDGRLTGPNGCEGREHEDVNCNGSLDRETDLNMNGEVDPQEDTGIPCQNELLCPEGIEPGTRGNGRLDSEDRNGNQRLDTVGNSGRTSFPFWVDRNGNGIPERGEFLAPEPADRDYRFADRNSGPFYFDYSDHRTRDTLREEISFFVPDRGGSHDLKLGGLLEQEGFSRLRHQRPILQPSGLAQSLLLGQTVRTIGVLLPTRAALNNRASGDHFGLFLQDTYKPLTNLTLGLGLRFDRETIGAWGYEPFDP